MAWHSICSGIASDQGAVAERSRESRAQAVRAENHSPGFRVRLTNSWLFDLLGFGMRALAFRLWGGRADEDLELRVQGIWDENPPPCGQQKPQGLEIRIRRVVA